MAEANEKLRQQMEAAPAGRFDIENVEEAQKVIEMVSVCLLVNFSFPAPCVALESFRACIHKHFENSLGEFLTWPKNFPQEIVAL